MKRHLWAGVGGGAIVAILLVMSPGRAAEPSAEKAAMIAFMRQKLAYSQGLTEGLTLAKFDLVTKNAVKLRDMTQSNIWTRVGQKDYALRTKEYQAAIEAVYKGGIDRDLNAATEAYTQTLKSCVECHRLLRAETVTGAR